MADRKRVVVLDDDRDIAEIIRTVLVDEGFAVSCLYGPHDESLALAVNELSPDCVILDGVGSSDKHPWLMARALAERNPAIPTVLLTESPEAREEAMLGESARARSSLVTATLPKPFDIDQLVVVVRNAMGATTPTQQSRKVARDDTKQLLDRLGAAGARDVRSSSAGREWVTFRATPDGDLFKVYRWQSAGIYFIGRYGANGNQLEPLADLSDTDAAIAYCEHLLKRERAEP